MSREAVAMLVMLNGFFHDLSVAMFLCALVVLTWAAAESRKESSPGGRMCLERLERLFGRIAAWSFVFLVIFGGVRTVFFKSHEWREAAGHGQLPALVVKHVAFVALIAAGLLYRLKLQRSRRIRGARPESAGAAGPRASDVVRTPG